SGNAARAQLPMRDAPQSAQVRRFVSRGRRNMSLESVHGAVLQRVRSRGHSSRDAITAPFAPSGRTRSPFEREKHMKRIIAMTFAALFAGGALAQSATVEGVKQDTREAKAEIKAEAHEAKANAREAKADIKADAHEAKADIKAHARHAKAKAK